jgi:hypothetical protein
VFHKIFRNVPVTERLVADQGLSSLELVAVSSDIQDRAGRSELTDMEGRTSSPHLHQQEVRRARSQYEVSSRQSSEMEMTYSSETSG